jgi:hypothetical protein
VLNTAALRAALMAVSPVSTRLTVAVDTPAAAATSLIVTGRVTAETISRDDKRPSTNRQAWRYPPFSARGTSSNSGLRGRTG